MRLEYDEDERALADTVRSWVQDTAASALTGAERRKSLAELGLLGATIGEEFGGSGLGSRFLSVISEELGAVVCASPVLGTAMASRLIAELDDAQRKAEWLPGLASGDRVLAVAWQDAVGGDEDTVARATRQDDGFALSGDKVLVLDGGEAEAFLVTAQVVGDPAEGATVFLVPRDRAGLTVHDQILLDGRGAARVILDWVRVTDADVVGSVGAAQPAFEHMRLEATVACCAEMVGGMRRAFEITAGYLTERVQFGRAIGSFQALQHRAARMFVAQILARPSARAAAWAVEEGKDAAKAVSHAKAVCSDAYLHIAQEAIQMHGGIGMTAAYPIGRYLKAARVNSTLFGDAQWHRARWATLSGY